MSGFYVNELLIRLLPRHDAHRPCTMPTQPWWPACTTRPPSRHGRCASSRSACSRSSAGASISSTTAAAADRSSRSVPIATDSTGGRGGGRVAEGELVLAGASLLSLAREELADPQSLADARRLLRAALDQCLDGRPLRTREVMLAMRSRGGPLPGG